MSRIEISKLLIVAGVGASICYGTILFSKSRLSDSIRGSIRDSIRGLQTWGKGLLNSEYPVEGEDAHSIDKQERFRNDFYKMAGGRCMNLIEEMENLRRDFRRSFRRGGIDKF